MLPPVQEYQCFVATDLPVAGRPSFDDAPFHSLLRHRLPFSRTLAAAGALVFVGLSSSLDAADDAIATPIAPDLYRLSPTLAVWTDRCPVAAPTEARVNRRTGRLAFLDDAEQECAILAWESRLRP